MPNVTYQRPVKAELYVHLDNGETFAATEEDLKSFGLVNKLDAYTAITNRMREALGDLAGSRGDLTRTELNPMRYLIECALMYPDHFTQFPDSMADLFAQVAQLEQRLRDNPAPDTDEDRAEGDDR